MAVASSLILWACQSRESELVVAPVAAETPEFYATMEQPGDPSTRVYADEDLMVLWNARDRISIFNRYTYNQPYRFDGETGDNAGSFSCIDDGSFVTGNEAPYIYAVYPYQENTVLSNQCKLFLTLPATQTYASDSFGIGANPMIAVTENNVLFFKNLCGYLKFRLYGEGVAVKSLKLEGNNGELLAGTVVVEAPLGGEPAVVAIESGRTDLTLNCPQYVKLGKSEEEATDFWFVLPPTVFENGITLTVTDVRGGTFEKSTQTPITVSRSYLTHLAPTQVEMPQGVIAEAVDLGLTCSWANVNLGAVVPEEVGTFYAWGELESKVNFDWSTYTLAEGSGSSLLKYNYQEGSGVVDNLLVLEPEDDAATYLWGDDWRMPTVVEWQELIDYCNWSWDTVNGVNGYNVKGPNGNSIFLPVTGRMRYEELNNQSIGYYWSSTLGNDNYYGPSEALYASISGGAKINSTARRNGLVIRPVYSKEVFYLSVPDEERSFCLYGGENEASIHVYANQKWSAYVVGSWLQIAEGESGEGDGVIRLTAANNEDEFRTACVVICDRSGIERYRIEITQDGILLEPNVTEIRAAYNTQRLQVSVNANTQWTVSKTDESDTWFSIEDPDGHEGNGSFSLVFEKNNEQSVRSSSVVVRNVTSGPGERQFEKVITIKQAYFVEPVRVVMDDTEMQNWESDWANWPVYTGNGTLFTAKARLHRASMPFGTYTFRWSNMTPDPGAAEGLRIRHWFCFDESCELRADIRPVDGKISFDFYAAGDGNKPSLSPYRDVDFTQPIELTYQFDPIGDGYCHVSYLVNGNIAASFVTSESCLRTVKQDAKILIYFGVDRSGSAVLDWYEYTPVVDWGD